MTSRKVMIVGLDCAEPSLVHVAELHGAALRAADHELAQVGQVLTVPESEGVLPGLQSEGS